MKSIEGGVMKPTEPKGYPMKGYPDETKDENKHHIDLRRFTAAVSYLKDH